MHFGAASQKCEAESHAKGDVVMVTENRALKWVLVSLLVLLLILLLVMLGMMVFAGATGGGMMAQMGATMGGGAMAACGLWAALVASALIFLIVLLSRSPRRLQRNTIPTEEMHSRLAR